MDDDVGGVSDDAPRLDYCWGDDCPKRFDMHGFPVYVSPTVDFDHRSGHEDVGRALEQLRAQFSYIVHPSRGIPNAALEDLRAAGVSVYLTGHEKDEWWPCGDGDGCYAQREKRIAFTASLLADLHGLDPLVLLHELAHAWHGLIVADGWRNDCIRRGYNESVHELGRYDEVRNQHWWSGRPPHEGWGTQRGYAATNEYEWFAESAEAYFLMNGSYPFHRHDLF
ncbi:MAG: hypothetical protein F4057_03875 [Acidobacteria bacterium]|nr:hypothetical protein [Acidobacteriota bacterium]